MEILGNDGKRFGFQNWEPGMRGANEQADDNQLLLEGDLVKFTEGARNLGPHSRLM